MYEMRETWTDGRMDDFAKHVDQRFEAVERRMENRFRETNARLDALQRTLLQMVGGAIVAGLIGVTAALIGVIATQL
jgi:hypothetical protein